MIRSRQRKVVAGRVAEVSTLRRARPAAGMQIHLGELLGWDDEGPVVEYPGNPRGPLRARVAGGVRGDTAAARPPAASLAGREVVLLVDARQRAAPVLLGFITPVGQEAAAPDLEARVDGKRVELDARDEIVLRCGQASITLRRNGRISIRGVDVETRAVGMNRIRGGAVDIN
jgi:hypothetical protein